MTETGVIDPLALLTPAEVCKLLGGDFSEQNLAQLRYLGSGPPYVKITGRQVRYRRSDVAEWIEIQTRVQTPGGPPSVPQRARRKAAAVSA